MITWKITNLNYLDEEQGLEKVVNQIHYYVKAESESGDQVHLTGTQVLNTESLNLKTFVNFDDLTEVTAIGWLKDSLGSQQVDELESLALHAVLEADVKSQKMGLPSQW